MGEAAKTDEVLKARDFQALMDFALRAGAPNAYEARRVVMAEGTRLLERLSKGEG